jgi:hydroxymethylpyrimidine pyrophosphatase-like HAD family hydrolase
MRYHVLACDYDGTLALHGRVDEPTVAALERLRGTGRRLVLVTGREMHELLAVFPQIDLFEQVVAENGALLYQPGSRTTKQLAEAPAEPFVAALRQRGVGPISVGKGIVATWSPHEQTVLQVIREQGLELQVIFNKGAVMVLPAGVNKATGLAAALKEMELSPHEVVGVGDAENDHAFLSMCECSVAVSNALPAVKERADLVMRGDHGAGVTELIDELITTDLREREQRLARHHLLLGTREGGEESRIPPYGVNLLIAGPSGTGKSTVATSFLERLGEHNYQFCIIDPEGDYDNMPNAVTLGDPDRAPTVTEVMQILKDPDKDLVVNLVGCALADRPPFFLALLPLLQEMRARTGRPHWLVVDEAHHLLPASWVPGQLALPQDLKRVLLITVHPDLISPGVLDTMDLLIAVGQTPQETIAQFCEAVPGPPCPTPARIPEPGEVVLWSRRSPDPPLTIRIVPSRMERRRHTRKYAEGELPPDRSFYFQGPEGKLNLRAQNLILFLQLAEGVDDETWLFHLRRGDYSRWFRERIKDEALADETARIEKQTGLSPAKSRSLVREAVQRNYTLPATPPLPMPGTDAAPKEKPGAL